VHTRLLKLSTIFEIDLLIRKGSTTKIKIQNFSSIGSKIRSIKINNETCAGNGWEVVDCKNGKLPESYIVPPSNSGDGLKVWVRTGKM
jgi:hypothetical protein